MQGRFKDLTPEEALIASKARGRKHLVCAVYHDFCCDLVWEWYTALCRTEPLWSQAWILQDRSTLAEN